VLTAHWGAIDLSVLCSVCGQNPLNGWIERFGKHRQQPDAWTLLTVVDRLQLYLPPISHIFPLFEFRSNRSVEVVPDLVKPYARNEHASWG
jgi:hypothetical protein